MAKKKCNICPITNKPVLDRKRSHAQYSKEGLQIHIQQYDTQYNKMYYLAKKLLPIGIAAELQDANRKTR